MSDFEQLRLNFEPTSSKLPSPERFPYNRGKHKVANYVVPDLLNSKNPLIVTGYTSLDKVIDFLCDCYQKWEKDEQAYKLIRLYLGHEPSPSQRQTFRLASQQLSQELIDYWLEKGISLFLCVKVLAAIKLIETNRVQVRISSEKLNHAKIYKGDEAVTIGSSNFSLSGLYFQDEGNSRFTPLEPERFKEAGQLGENYWNQGKDYQAEILALLNRLLKIVSWREALARACAELLEGDWAKRYIKPSDISDELPLWPSQERGIAQAIWTIDNFGAVLVADATGSGKTRKGAHLIRSVINHLWRMGRMRRDLTILVCPPLVEESWQRETTNCGTSIQIYSHGILSAPNSDKHQNAMNAVRRAQVLAVDEAHNFLNRGSQRTRKIFGNMADYVLLFTATPINRGPQDLLAIVDLLGADNFDDQVLQVIERIGRRGRPNETMSVNERVLLKRQIQKFTVRRTKKMLNSLVDKEPESYKNSLGQLCRYPRHEARTYSCQETKSDRSLAQSIRELSANLRGLINLQSSLEVSDAQRDEGLNEENYLNWRLKGAVGLATHHIASNLRSSRAALLEHLRGTKAAKDYFQLQDKIKQKETGNLINQLREGAGHPPPNRLSIPLPDWLTDAREHERVCQEEMAIYEQIASLVTQMSPARENAKAQLLSSLIGKHQIVLAFDRHLITLYDIKQRLQQQCNYQILVGTGNSETDKKLIKQVSALGSKATQTIILCSDALSEGVNLQQASAVVQLDLPSVIRLAEQRIGRVDRMDSPHASIEVYWPDDSSEFALRADERFFERHQFVAQVLGSNLPLPESLAVPTEQIIAELENPPSEAQNWEELQDAFEPIRCLISGDSALILEETYEQLRDSRARVISSVSLVEANHPWAFFAIKGTERNAPRWVYFERPQADPITDLEIISSQLRQNLGEQIVDLPFSDRAAELLELFLDSLNLKEELLLSQKKQRALAEMRQILPKYQQTTQEENQRERRETIENLVALFSLEKTEQAVDLGLVAECWLDLIRPVWYEKLVHRRRSKPLLLKDLRSDLIKKPLSTEELQKAFNVELHIPPLDQRIVAAILGIA